MTSYSTPKKRRAPAKRAKPAAKKAVAKGARKPAGKLAGKAGGVGRGAVPQRVRVKRRRAGSGVAHSVVRNFAKWLVCGDAILKRIGGEGGGGEGGGGGGGGTQNLLKSMILPGLPRGIEVLRAKVEEVKK